MKKKLYDRVKIYDFLLYKFQIDNRILSKLFLYDETITISKSILWWCFFLRRKKEIQDDIYVKYSNICTIKKYTGKMNEIDFIIKFENYSAIIIMYNIFMILDMIIFHGSSDIDDEEEIRQYNDESTLQ